MVGEPDSDGAMNRHVTAFKLSGIRFAPSIWLIIGLVCAWLHGWMYGLLHGVMGGAFVQQTLFVLIPLGFVWGTGESQRLVASILFFLFGAVCMSLSSGFTWFRNPDQPPLPDVVHELVPHIQQYNLTLAGRIIVIDVEAIPDMCIMLMVLLTSLLTAFNRHSMAMARRFFTVYGLLMLFRSICIVVTSLPDAHPACRKATPGTSMVKDMEIRDVIARGLQMLVPVGHFTCGDMVYSGHTMVLVLCGMMWHTYYKIRPGTFAINPVKVLIWLIVVVGLFFIVVTRLHYTLDVIVALYLSATLWSAYHRIANDIAKNHRFVSVWIVDAAVLYPCIEWMEACAIAEHAVPSLHEDSPVELADETTATGGAIVVAADLAAPNPNSGADDPLARSKQVRTPRRTRRRGSSVPRTQAPH